jgi:ATP-dependent DNA ligase
VRLRHSDGVAIFDALHRRGTVSEAMLYAFDLLELDGENLRACRWSTARSGWRGCWAGTGSASS